MSANDRAKGPRFERLIADGLAQMLGDDRIDRRPKQGSKDRGDVGGVRLRGARLVIECKNCARLDLPGWTAEAEVERGNDDALAGVVVHKRRGKGQAADQWVTMTLGELAAIINGHRGAPDTKEETS